MSQLQTIFADALQGATIQHGVVRLQLAETGGDGKTVPCAQLAMPLSQLPAFVTGLNNLLRQLEQRIQEQQGAGG